MVTMKDFALHAFSLILRSGIVMVDDRKTAHFGRRKRAFFAEEEPRIACFRQQVRRSISARRL